MTRRVEGELPPRLYEDEHLVAFDKPAGLLIAPDRWDRDRENLMTLVHERYARDCFNVHRLDRETSGIVVCARTKPALDAMSRAFEDRAVVKTYIALVRSAPPSASGVISLKMSPDPKWPGRMRVDPHGKPAETEYEVAARWRGFTRVHLHPVTGRTHQLRVHLAGIGCPIVADRFYGDGRGLYLSEFKRGYREGRGDERPLVGRVALHAWTLSFAHPVTGAAIAIEAPIPKDLGAAFRQLERNAS